MYDLDCYNEKFYEYNRSVGLKMAEWEVPALIEIFNPNYFFDVGCGTGHLVKTFSDHGILGIGIDGSEYAVKNKLVPPVDLFDLRKELTVDKEYRFDLVISFEVAEHIDPEYADVYLNNLCALGDTIIMTAAIPGQGGEHHVNEQPAEYWINKFKERGYAPDYDKIEMFRQKMQKAKCDGFHVEPYMFITNILVFERSK